MNKQPRVRTKPPITANNLVDLRRHNVIVIGDTMRAHAIDNEPTIPLNQIKINAIVECELSELLYLK